MAALRLSVLSIALLCSCAFSQPDKDLEVESSVDGCFVFKKIALDTTKEPVVATALLTVKTGHTDCPCKSALMKYSATQKKDGNTFNLLSGQFSILGKEAIALPIAVQKQLIFAETPIRLSLSCGDN